MAIPDTLDGQIVEIFRRIGEIERRARNRKRTGKIDELDLEKGLARVDFGEGFRSAWLPWKEVAAGGIKTHIPPTLGEQVDVVSENGDLTDAVIDMSSPSNDNPRPHDGADAVITHGDVRITISEGQVTVKAPVVLVESPDVRLGGNGGPQVARIGDLVAVGAGSSAGNWPIVTGSDAVTAI